jgi:hypothetical protein
VSESIVGFIREPLHGLSQGTVDLYDLGGREGGREGGRWRGRE